jgi:sulfite exporter TauE/SafE
LDASLATLLVASVTVAGTHTFIGVDHYLPFVVLGRARQWPLSKVLGLTALCGLGHVVGSIVLGFAGIGLGYAVSDLIDIESVRGSLAAWSLIAFGLAYATWALVHMMRAQRHTHVHAHEDGVLHNHDHDHHDEHLHAHAGAGLTIWAVFIIFVLGPCEPLIPLLMAPAWQYDWVGVAAVAGTFSVTTIAMMMTMATIGSLGLRLVSLKKIHRYAHVLAGLAIFSSGMAIQLLGI